MTDNQRFIDRQKIKLVGADTDLSSSRRIINENFKLLSEEVIRLKDINSLSKLTFPSTFSAGEMMMLRAERDGKFSIVKSQVGIGTKYKFVGETITIPKNHQYIVTKVELLSGSQIIQEPGGELVVLEQEIEVNLKNKEIAELTTTGKTVVSAINELKNKIENISSSGGGGSSSGGGSGSGSTEESNIVKGNNFKKQ